MNPTGHQYEDKLLEFAYGELSARDAEAVEAHVKGCARCSEVLATIGGVRRTMQKLPDEAVPETGLESLLAYAEQSARRSAAGAPARDAWWRRWITPLAAVTALGLVGVVAFRVTQQAQDEAPSEGVPAPQAAAFEKEKDLQPAAERAQPEPAPAAAFGQAAPSSGALAKQDALERKTMKVTPTVRRSDPADGWPGSNAGKGIASAGASYDDEARAPPAPAATAAPKQEALGGLDMAERESMKVSVGTRGGTGGAKKKTAEEEPQRAEAKAAPPSELPPLAARARDAQAAGDAPSELSWWTRVLASNPTPSEKYEALDRLCALNESLGRVAEAQRYCGQLLAEFPQSLAARKRREAQEAGRAKSSAPAKAAPASPTSAPPSN